MVQKSQTTTWDVPMYYKNPINNVISTTISSLVSEWIPEFWSIKGIQRAGCRATTSAWGTTDAKCQAACGILAPGVWPCRLAWREWRFGMKNLPQFCGIFVGVYTPSSKLTWLAMENSPCSMGNTSPQSGSIFQPASHVSFPEGTTCRG